MGTVTGTTLNERACRTLERTRARQLYALHSRQHVYRFWQCIVWFVVPRRWSGMLEYVICVNNTYSVHDVCVLYVMGRVTVYGLVFNYAVCIHFKLYIFIFGKKKGKLISLTLLSTDMCVN